MNLEKQTSKIANVYEQIYQHMWASWTEILQGWNETMERSVKAWEESYHKTLEAQLGMLQTKASEGKEEPMPSTEKTIKEKVV